MSRAGRGRVAVLLGEPGIGKSRLMAEFKGFNRRERRNLGCELARGSLRELWPGLLPYHLVFDLVRSMLSLPQTGIDVLPRAVLDERLTALLGDQAEDVTPYFAHLLAMPMSDAEKERIQGDPAVLQSRYVASLARVVRAFAERGPVVVVCEDIHWADPASVEVMSAFFRS